MWTNSEEKPLAVLAKMVMNGAPIARQVHQVPGAVYQEVVDALGLACGIELHKSA